VSDPVCSRSGDEGACHSDNYEWFRCRWLLVFVRMRARPTGNVIPPSSRSGGAVDVDREGWPRGQRRFARSVGPVTGEFCLASRSKGDAAVANRHGAGADAGGGRPVTGVMAVRRRANPVRLTLARQLGHDIDGAWWPRTGRIAGELADLVAVLGTRLGAVIDINVNWSSLERPPDLNWLGWQHKHQHVMTIVGGDGRANLLIVPYTTDGTLARMVLRQAADLPVDPAHRESLPFHTAEAILRAARLERAPRSGDAARELEVSAAGPVGRDTRTVAPDQT
jgi:hypothetical protein